jgi:N-acetylneuraminic acid mutarotase
LFCQGTLTKTLLSQNQLIIECATFEGAEQAMLVWSGLFANRVTALALILISLAALGMVAIKPVAASEDFWTQKTAMHVARNGLGVAVVDGKIYAVGGSTESGSNVNIGGIVGTNEEYDPTTDKWKLKASMLTPRSGFAIASYEGKVYCIGGITDYSSSAGYSMTDINEVYDPATDTWSEKASLPTARRWGIATVVGSKIYVFGGNPDKQMQVYNTETDSWTTMSLVPTAVTKSISGSVLLDNKVLVIDKVGKLEVYDPETDSWEFGASPPSLIYGGDAGATTGALAPKRAYFLGLNGFMDQGPMPNRIYDPKTGSWTYGAPVPTNRINFAVAVVNDIIYAIGGRSYTFPYPADSPYIITQSTANEAYTPIGYGTPDSDYKPPTPSPSSSPSPSPTPSPEPRQLEQFPATWVAAVAVPAAVVSIILFVYFKKHRRQTEK